MTAQPSYEQTITSNYMAIRARLMNPLVVIKPTLQPVVKTINLSAPKPVREVFVEPPRKRRLVRSITAIDEPSPFEYKFIIDEVCAEHGFSYGEILGGQRNKKLVAARHKAFYRLSKETALSLPGIGRVMGGKDHTTVLHGIRQHARKLLVAAGQVMQ